MTLLDFEAVVSDPGIQTRDAKFANEALVTCAYAPTLSEARGNLGTDFSTGGADPWNAGVGAVDWQRSQWVAEFKGVPFCVESDSRIGGRRIQVHEYPSREYWDNEDLGRLRQQIEVTAYVFGDSSDLWAEKLFAACTSPGASQLYLPMRVPLSAVCLSVESTFRAERMGRIDFQMTFSIDTGQAAGQLKTKYVTRTQLQGEVFQSTTAISEASRDSFETGVTGTPAVAHVTLADSIREVGTLMRAAAKASRLSPFPNTAIDYTANRFLTESDAMASKQRSISNTMTRTAYTSAQRPPTLNYFPVAGSGVALRTSTGEVMPAKSGKDEGFGGLFVFCMRALAAGAAANPSDLAQALIPLTNMAPTKLRALATSAGAGTASVKAELKLAEALCTFVRRISLCNSIMAGIHVAPERQPDASLTRSRLLEQIDEEIAIAGSDTRVRDGLVRLRASVVRFTAFFSTGGSGTVAVPEGWASQPLCNIAANLYANGKVAGRDAELMRFNGIEHPLFAPDKMDALFDKSMSVVSNKK